MFRKTKLCTGLMVACGGVLLSAGHSAVAQTTPAPGQSLERVEITGSNIRRADAETASPVQVITKNEIDQAGKGTVAEYLQTLTADGQGSVPFTYGRGFSGATAAGISLRGLGANATLVLINGRRATSAVLADDAQRTYVDLNQIPLEAVERIEVLKDGASAIYGSDAVAGVVNIILRKNYVGTALKASYGVSQEGDGNEARAAVTHGFGDLGKDGYNVLLNFEAGKKDPIYYRDRVGPRLGRRVGHRPAAVGLRPELGPDQQHPARRAATAGFRPSDTPSGRVNNSAAPSIVGNVRNPTRCDYYSRSDPAGVGFTQFFPGAATFCNANANLPQNNPAGGCINDVCKAISQIQPEHETASFYGRLTKAITRRRWKASSSSATTTRRRRSTACRSRRAPASSSLTAPWSRKRRLRCSVRITRTTRTRERRPGCMYLPSTTRALPRPTRRATRTGSSPASRASWNAWDFDTGVVYSESRQTDTSTKTLNWRVKNALLNPTAANVAAATAFSPAYAALPAGTLWRIGENAGLNSAAMYDALLSDQERNGYSKLYSADFKVSREFGQLQGGPIGVAFGAEIRREDNDLPFYTGLGDYVGLSLTAYGGARNIYATYAEVALPVLKNVELNGALALRPLHRCRQLGDAEVRRQVACAGQLRAARHVRQGVPGAVVHRERRQLDRCLRWRDVDDNARCAASPVCPRRPSTRTATAWRRRSSSAATRTSSPRSRRA